MNTSKEKFIKNIIREMVEAIQIIMEKKDKKWIQKAIKKKGSLRAAAQKAGKINSQGKIDSEWLRQQASKNTKTGKRARLALTLKKLRKK